MSDPDQAIDPIEELLVECMDRADREGPAAFEAVLAEHPEHAAALRAELDKLERMGLLDGRTASDADVLGGFRLLRELRSGGEGTVYLAEQESPRRLVAVKTIPLLVEGSPDRVARALREARNLARLSHPNIVHVIAAGERDGQPFLATELLHGEDLDAVIARARDQGEPLTARRVLRWGLELAHALEHAHAAGVVHRDVKPANVRITPDDRAVLMDFGIARGEGEATLTLEGAFRGTVRYTAPERVTGEHADDPRSDVYSLGLVLYECLAGRPAVGGETTEQMLREVLSPRAALPALHRDRFPRDLGVVLRKATEKDLGHRYATAAELARDLGALLAYRPIAAKPPGPLRRTALWARRHRVGAAALAVLLLAALALPVVLAARQRQHDNEQREQARIAVTAARSRLAEYSDLRQRVAELQREVRARRQAIEEAYVPPARLDELMQRELELRRLLRERDASFAGGLQQVFAARRLDPALVDSVRVEAALYRERWRQSRDADDPREAAFYLATARTTDPGAGAAAADRGTLHLTTEPPGAEVFLFRLAEQTELDDLGEPRRVPVAVPPAPTPIVAPGTHTLRVVNVAEPLAPGDQIVQLAGHPIRGSLLVLAGNDTVPPLARLVEADDRPLHNLFEVDYLASLDRRARRAGDEPVHRFVFEHAGRRLEATGSLADLGIEVVDARMIAEHGPEAGLAVRATVQRNGALRELELPAGLHVRHTAAPLLVHPGGSSGYTPVRDLPVELGSYVALLRLQGYEDLRLPVELTDPRELELHVELHPLGTSPEGFVPVTTSPELHVTRPFWIQEREMTFGDYLPFLNDPEIRARIAASEEPILVPRVEDRGRVQIVLSDVDGEWRAPPNYREDLPLYGVTHHDAVAYAEWRTRGHRAAGGQFTFRLPTPRQWELAAGLPGRWRYPFGDHFEPKWVKSRFTHAQVYLEPVLRHPVDESALGVFDLTGSQTEMCRDPGMVGVQPARGGRFTASREADFVVARDGVVAADRPINTLGFRLVAVREP